MVWFIVAFICGLFLWSFAEYAIHNWLIHWARGKNIVSKEHLAHHKDTNYFVSVWRKIAISFLFVPVVGGAASLLVGIPVGVTFALGFAFAYFAYEVVHRRVHVVPPSGWYSRWARKHHFYHHFHAPRKNHGVTSPIWDWIFRTYAKPAQIRVPEEKAMPWLLDANRELDPKYAGEYKLVRARTQLTNA